MRLHPSCTFFILQFFLFLFFFKRVEIYIITQMKVYNKTRHHILYQRTRNIFERNPISLLVKGPSNPSFCPNKDTSDFIPLFKAKLDKALE